uniref:RING-type domain-containing protein n=1 Tax=Ascaris lumbricoides TaxID=6252 RepID=A0A9J2P9Y0_ASCLU
MVLLVVRSPKYLAFGLRTLKEAPARLVAELICCRRLVMAQWWLHCNGCGILMLEAKQQRPGNRYWLSACGHVFCDQCNRKCERDRKCRCCRHSSFRSAAVDSTLPENVRKFFKPVGRLYEDAMQQLNAIVGFQRTHMEIACSILREKQAQLSEEARGSRAAAAERDNLKREIASLNESLQYQRTVLTDIANVCREASNRLKLPLPYPFISGADGSRLDDTRSAVDVSGKHKEVRGNDSVMASLNATLASGQNEGTISSMLDQSWATNTSDNLHRMSFSGPVATTTFGSQQLSQQSMSSSLGTPTCSSFRTHFSRSRERDRSLDPYMEVVTRSRSHHSSSRAAGKLRFSAGRVTSRFFGGNHHCTGADRMPLIGLL